MTISHHQCPLYDQFRNPSRIGQSERKSKNIMNGTPCERNYQYPVALCIQNRIDMSRHRNDCMTDNPPVAKSQTSPKASQNII